MKTVTYCAPPHKVPILLVNQDFREVFTHLPATDECAGAFADTVVELT